MTVPFFDLRLQYDAIKDEMDTRILECIRQFEYIKGKDVTGFEQLFGEQLYNAQIIATGNGTDSLFTALKVLGTSPGDEIITPAFSWISSAETITLCSAKPVFVDIDPVTYTIDPHRIEEKITAKTKGIIAVHLYGQAAHVQELKKICDWYNLFLIEDCAQAHFTVAHGQHVGTIGTMAAFSFYPTKNLGAYGDAGCIATHDLELAEKARRFANHGALRKDDHLLEGINSRMDTLQAAILTLKLPHLARWNSMRIQHAHLYGSGLSGIEEIILPHVREDTTHTFHIYAIRAKKRDQLKEYLEQRGIQTMIHYPSALPNLQAYRYLNHQANDFPVSNTMQTETLSLPVYPELTENQILYVCKNIKDFYAEKGI